jgi:S-adenosylmethionine decarboxylase proenzyme
MHVGVHYIVDVDNVPGELIHDHQALLRICEGALQYSESNVLNKMMHEFKPQGMTIIYLLAESHFSMHTWPEHKKIRMDFFSCTNESQCTKACEYLKRAFGNARVSVKKLYR